MIDRCFRVKHNAYNPYSKFPVGAALMCDDGTIYTGNNIFTVRIRRVQQGTPLPRKTKLTVQPLPPPPLPPGLTTQTPLPRKAYLTVQPFTAPLPADRADLTAQTRSKERHSSLYNTHPWTGQTSPRRPPPKKDLAQFTARGHSSPYITLEMHHGQ